MIRINSGLSIPTSELRFSASRGGGPGGQHVNKVASRVTLSFDVRNSPSLDDADRARLEDKLRSRITTAGILSLSSHSTQSQAANRADVVERFATLGRAPVRRRRRGRPTGPGAASRGGHPSSDGPRAEEPPPGGPNPAAATTARTARGREAVAAVRARLALVVHGAARPAGAAPSPGPSRTSPRHRHAAPSTKWSASRWSRSA